MLRRFLDALRHAKHAAQARRALPDGDWRARCAAGRVPLDAVRLEPEGGLYLERLGLRIPRSDGGAEVLKGYRILVELASTRGTRIEWSDARDCVELHHAGVCYPAHGVEELWILRELLVEGDYDLLPPGPAVIVDVGANVGFVSLYLAAQRDDLLVHGFEPLALNFDRAMDNLAANPALRPRITLHNEALSGTSGERTLLSVPGHRGRSSLVAPPVVPEPVPVIEQHPVQVRRACEAVARVLAAHVSRTLVLKLDCEGSEYGILDDLAEAGLLDAPQVYLLEWHTVAGRSVETLRTLLCGAGYHVHTRGRTAPAGSGMMIAVRAGAPAPSGGAR